MLDSRGLKALAAGCLVLFAVIGPANFAGAAAGDTELSPGWFIHDATASCPQKPTRHLDSNHAAAFIQSWYIATIYGTLTQENPPATLPVCNFKARDTINGDPFTFRAFYATNGKKAWVGLPPQTIGPGAIVPAEKWFVATPRATPAFLGKVPFIKPVPPTTTTTVPATTLDKKGSGSSAGWVVGGILLAVVLAGAIAQFVRSRRRAPTA
jgi:hypothetical protein